MRLNSAKEEMIDAIFETLSCLVVVDAEGRIIHLNNKYADILGVSLEKAIGESVDDIIPNTRMSLILTTGKEEIGSVFRMKNGETVVCNRFPIKKNGKIIGAFAHTTFTNNDEVKVFIKQINDLNNELNQYRCILGKLQEAKYSLKNIIGNTPSINRVTAMIKKVAQTKSTVLIIGATGTGKELVAHAIHQEGKRRYKPFIRLNCAAIPKELLESELFGYEEGAFTGAKKGGKPGKFELAEGGSLLLDEINQLPLNMQAKLLRVIQEKEIERVGGTKTKDIDVRLICISNIDLAELVRKGEFREDLYYRINVVQINLPTLRERLGDIEELTNYFIAKINRNLGISITGISKDALNLFKSYDWPGNIRELEFALERAANCVLSGPLEVEHFDFLYQRLNRPNKQVDEGDKEVQTLNYIRSEAEKEAIINAMIKTNGNKRLAAQYLKIDRSILYDKLKKYNITL